MRYQYAQIDPAGVCVGVIDTDRPIDAPHMIPIPAADPAYIGRTYADGAWQG